MVERCPGCGHRFEREAGFFLGALVINFAVTAGLLAGLMGVMIGILASGGDTSGVIPIVAIAAVETVLVPVFFYPFSKTTWSAIDLALRRGEFPKGAGGGRG